MKAHEKRVYRGVGFSCEYSRGRKMYFRKSSSLPITPAELESKLDDPEEAQWFLLGATTGIRQMKKNIDAYLDAAQKVLS